MNEFRVNYVNVAQEQHDQMMPALMDSRPAVDVGVACAACQGLSSAGQVPTPYTQTTSAIVIPPLRSSVSELATIPLDQPQLD